MWEWKNPQIVQDQRSTRDRTPSPTRPRKRGSGAYAKPGNVSAPGECGPGGPSKDRANPPESDPEFFRRPMPVGTNPANAETMPMHEACQSLEGPPQGRAGCLTLDRKSPRSIPTGSRPAGQPCKTRANCFDTRPSRIVMPPGENDSRSLSRGGYDTRRFRIEIPAGEGEGSLHPRLSRPETKLFENFFKKIPS